MATNYETGHAKNVANFEDLISFCTGYSSAYNPTRESIKIDALNTKLTEAVNVLAAVNAAIPPSTNTINQREIAFAPLGKLMSRVVSAVAASDVATQVVDDVKTIVRKLQGRRATPKKETTPDDPQTPQNESSKSHSASQMSYDSRIENLHKLIQLLSSLPGYKPNEPDLSVAGLTTLLTNLKAANTAAINAYTPLSNTRLARNNVLYNTQNGLVVIANYAKAYVKSIYGASSPQYKQISKLKFSAGKNK